MNKQPLCLYLHGLNSSPHSQKARQTVEYLNQRATHKAGLNIEIVVPQLSTEPSEIICTLVSITKTAVKDRAIYIIGSSLGGYLGTWLHQYLLSLQHGQPVKLVIVNPVTLDETALGCHLFDAFIGPQFNVYTGERWELTQNHCDQLRKLNVETLNCTDSIFLLAQAGDEILDYRLAEQKYKNCRLLVQQGGDHSFVDYHKALPDIFAFLTDQAS